MIYVLQKHTMVKLCRILPLQMSATNSLPQTLVNCIKKSSQEHGVDISHPTQYNIYDWLTPGSTFYKPAITSAVFHYVTQIEKDD